MRITEYLKERFFKRFDKKESGCWEWSARKDQCGYGNISHDYKELKAHRVSWTIFKGDIPANMCVCHHCDNPACVNPDHLFLGSHKDNMDDRDRKKRCCRGEKRSELNRQFGIKGERVYNSKLNADKVKEIVMLRRQGLKFREIADKFGVKHPTVQGILNGRYWRHVTGIKDKRDGINI